MVIIEGVVVGNVSAGGRLLVAKGGTIDGEVVAAEAVVAGEVRGPVRASSRVDVQASGVIFGTVTTPRIAIEEGATLDVQLFMRQRQPMLHRGAA